MSRDALFEQILAAPEAFEPIASHMSDDEALALAQQLKVAADQQLWVNANRSLELGNLIVRLGTMRGQDALCALGMLQQGDALRALGQIEAAWSSFQRAGEHFCEVDDAIGWARTRIGRLLCAVEINRVPEALADAETARQIFTSTGEHERLLALMHSVAITHTLVGDFAQAIAIYDETLAFARAHQAQRNLGLIHSDAGFAHYLKGDFRSAVKHYEQARELCTAQQQTRAIAMIELNLGDLAIAQSQHRYALQMLYQARDHYRDEQLLLDMNDVNRSIIVCYLELNRLLEARNLAIETAHAYQQFGATYTEALTRMQLAIAEARLGHYAAAQQALDDAERMFTALGAANHIAETRLRRAQIALRVDDLPQASQLSEEAANAFAQSGAQVEFASATLLRGQLALSQSMPNNAYAYGHTTLRIARDCKLPSLRYSAHLLLGQVADACQVPQRAARHYSAAMATIDRAQRGLTLTLRTNFLEDKSEALHHLMRLRLGNGQQVHAFETLERAKSQTLLGYLANREQLRWSSNSAVSAGLITELEHLREEHQWFYHMAYETPVQPHEQRPSITIERVRAELLRCERRMREITEQLYLASNATQAAITVPCLSDVQQHLPPDTLLLEYYNDGTQLWAFAVSRHAIECYQLPCSVAEIEHLLAQLQSNIDFALNAGPEAPTIRGLTQLAQRMLQRLYTALLVPLAARVAQYQRLMIVPYGALHYLPFHLLFDGSRYLIEQRELVTLPAAGLVSRHPQSRSGARILAYSWEGRLPHTLLEGQLVQQLIGGDMYHEAGARRQALPETPTQILHIAAHGRHRLDQPDLSYIQLADGQLFTDDLLQRDMSYELVVLSACETGRATVSAGDELIGLGRGFLYAGAGALLTSLWRVADDMTIQVMSHFYQALGAGASKAAALRRTQLAMLAEQPRLHPAFWGAFQLVGDAAPLSTTVVARKDAA